MARAAPFVRLFLAAGDVLVFLNPQNTLKHGLQKPEIMVGEFLLFWVPRVSFRPLEKMVGHYPK